MTFGLAAFIVPRVPVIATPNVPVARETTVQPTVGLRWGKAGLTLATASKVGIRLTVPADDDEWIVREGPGVDQALDHEGNIVTTGDREGYFGEETGSTKLFFIKSFVEFDEEIKVEGRLQTITPIERHVDLYVKADFLTLAWGPKLTHQYTVSTEYDHEI
jgi:hypothetical protein